MVDEQVSVGARVEADAEPEPADPLITPATALERPERRPPPAHDKQRNAFNLDKESTISRTRLSIRNGKENPFIGEMLADEDNKENQANGKLDSPVRWPTQNGSDSGTYAEIGGVSGAAGDIGRSDRDPLDADSSEEEVPLIDAASPGRSSDGPEPRPDIGAQLDRGGAERSRTGNLSPAVCVQPGVRNPRIIVFNLRFHLVCFADSSNFGTGAIPQFSPVSKKKVFQKLPCTAAGVALLNTK
ncbi:hypothetical protein EVAR_84515_1 [Eumeta japonica]|uniref:Uncharacterized protein n=1 Tax=Eumeta variegata TaxID=151549 RepID=A0A4C1UJ31_EUMVA|nr:hypothetical protein EVAR_84515_1 [Eumeta japonica]